MPQVRDVADSTAVERRARERAHAPRPATTSTGRWCPTRTRELQPTNAADGERRAPRPSWDAAGTSSRRGERREGVAGRGTPVRRRCPRDRRVGVASQDAAPRSGASATRVRTSDAMPAAPSRTTAWIAACVRPPEHLEERRRATQHRHRSPLAIETASATRRGVEGASIGAGSGSLVTRASSTAPGRRLAPRLGKS